MQDQHDFLSILSKQAAFDNSVGTADISCGVAEVALDDALDQVEDDAIRAVMHARDRTTECQGQTIGVALEPMVTGQMLVFSVQWDV